MLLSYIPRPSLVKYGILSNNKCSIKATCSHKLPICYIVGVFPDAFKFQENLKKLREMLQEPTLRELLKKSLSPDHGCSAVFKAVVCI